MISKLKRFFSKLGPGFVTGASDDDPSGIATYSQTGAQFGYNQLWTALFSFPFMAVIQEMCGRVGVVTGKGLARVIKTYYAKSVLYVSVLILLIANTINIGADLGAMASSGQLVLGVPFIIWLFGLTALSLFLEIVFTYPQYARLLKFLTFSLFAYVIVAFIVHQNWSKIVFSTFIPGFSLSRDYLLNIVAVLGTTISPYLFFWEADEEVEEEVAHHKLRFMGQGVPRITKLDIRNMRIDTIVGMFFSNLVMFFIIVSTASTLGIHGITNIETADQAAVALKPLAGNFASIIFALGIIGTGLLAVPILAGSASYAISEAINWEAGLSKKFKQAHGFYGVIIFATLIGILINFTPIKPFQMLYYTAVLNGICAPPLLVIIMLISNNKRIMGEHTNSKFSNILGWGITLVMTVAAFGLLLTLGKP